MTAKQLAAVVLEESVFNKTLARSNKIQSRCLLEKKARNFKDVY